MSTFLRTLGGLLVLGSPGAPAKANPVEPKPVVDCPTAPARSMSGAAQPNVSSARRTTVFLAPPSDVDEGRGQDTLAMHLEIQRLSQTFPDTSFEVVFVVPPNAEDPVVARILAHYLTGAQVLGNLEAALRQIERFGPTQIAAGLRNPATRDTLLVAAAVEPKAYEALEASGCLLARLRRQGSDLAAKNGHTPWANLPMFAVDEAPPFHETRPGLPRLRSALGETRRRTSSSSQLPRETSPVPAFVTTNATGVEGEGTARPRQRPLDIFGFGARPSRGDDRSSPRATARHPNPIAPAETAPRR